MRPVRLHIDELELDGLDPAGRFDVARGLEGELVRLLNEQGVPAGLAAGAELAPLSLQAAPHLSPHELGCALARALYAGWQ